MSAQPSSSSMERGASTSPLRPISFGDPVVNIERRDDGTIYLRPKQPLGDYPARITDRLHHWASATPDRVFMAEREGGRGWRKISYAELLAASRHIASGLIARGLSAERPVVILSGNSIDHALLAFGAFYAGIPFCPVSPAYSLVSKDYGKLSYLMKLLTPGLVFAEDADKFADALAANVSLGTEIAASYGHVPGRDVTLLADLMATPIRGDLDEVHGKIGPDTIAKFLLTSGSTGNPKAVINTQRMICANQVMLRETLAFLRDEPPVIIDWLPWNHTFGGNHNIGLTLYNGGSMYLDAGKPVPGGIEETVRNLQEISPTVYLQRPQGLRVAAALSARRPAPPRKILRPAARDVLLGRGAVAVRLEQPRRAGGEGKRLPRTDADRPRCNRDRAVLHVGQPAHQPLRPCRASRIRQ
ncbi:acyl-coenzyme A synthetase/AMP-(fatty) acid ligase [Bradyrhizobium sp. GM0.4]